MLVCRGLKVACNCNTDAIIRQMQCFKEVNGMSTDQMLTDKAAHLMHH